MAEGPDAHDVDWQPATSRPGELLSFEGRARALGAFARGARNHDPRLRAYRRPMQRMALGFAAAVALLVAVAALVG